MRYVYDLIFILLVVLAVRRGRRDGFLSSLLGLIAWLAALACSVLWSDALARWVYDGFVRERLVSAVSASLPADLIAAANSGAASTQAALDGVQSFLSALSGTLGPPFSGIDTGAARSVLNLMSQDGLTLAQAVTDQVLQPVALHLLNVIASVALFAAALIVFGLLRRLTRVRRRPTTFLGKTNRFFGGVLGLGEGLVSGYLFAVLLSLAASLTGDTLSWLNSGLLRGTLIVSMFLP